MTASREDRNAALLRQASLLVGEVAALLALWPVLEEVEWDRATAGRPSPDESGRRVTGGHSDPTADLATDPTRLYVRQVVTRCEETMADALANARGVRRAMERALASWSGPDDL